MKFVYNIAIVGRPNVGKSRLFNRLIKQRKSIVHDMAGVTRDVITHEIDKNIILMDTGGLGLSGANSITEITHAVDDQVCLAIASADLVFFVVDATDGIMPMDYDIADMLRKSGKSVVVIANKVDSENRNYDVDVFKKFGLGDPVSVSAEHGVGEVALRNIIDEATKSFRKQQTEEENVHDVIKVAFVGRPNVGKSSTVNALLNEHRMIVSDVPGTTREAVSSKLFHNDGINLTYDFELLDTAGARPQNRVTTSLDYFSSLRTSAGIINCDIIYLVVDATSGITQLDKKLANEIISAGKGIILVVNKWDISQDACKNGDLDGYDSIKSFQEAYVSAIRKEFRAFPDVEIIFTSANTKHGIKHLLPLAEKLYVKMHKKFGTGEINRVIQQAFEARQPSTASGKRFKIYYAVQTGNMPFSFKLFCNRKALLRDNYKKYLLNCMRKHFDFAGCTIKLEFVEKDRRYSTIEE